MAKAREKTVAVEALTHKEAKRLNIPTAEFESLMRDEEKSPVRITYEYRNRDLDPPRTNPPPSRRPPPMSSRGATRVERAARRGDPHPA